MLKNLFKSVDLYLFIPAFLLVFLSFYMLSSFDPGLARTQALYAFVGIVCYFVLMNIHPTILREYAMPAYFGVLLLLIVVFFLGEMSHGANRWIGLWGDTKLQPSEFAKPVLIVVFAGLFAQYKRLNLQLFGRSALLLGVYFLLVYHQPDLGTAMTFVFIWLLCLYLTDTSMKRLLLVVGIVVAIGVIAAPIVWNALHDYQRNRILVFLDPERDPLGTGYHVLQAMITVGSGELYGKGFAKGTQTRNNFLPEHYTDFAFAAYAEQFGFVGSMILLALYGFLLYRLLIIAQRSQNRYSSYIVMATAGLFFTQIFINIGMNTGIVPVAGITLPLFSYGGSSLISFLMCLGLVQGVAKYNDLKSVHEA